MADDFSYAWSASRPPTIRRPAYRIRRALPRSRDAPGLAPSDDASAYIAGRQIDERNTGDIEFVRR